MTYAATLACAAILVSSCDRILPQPEPELPAIETVETLYAEHGLRGELRYSGNVVELTVQQPPDQLVRGGSLWARVGPYVYLFTPGTQELLRQFPAIAGVRVITMVDDTEVARALLVSDTLNEITWRRARNVLGAALAQGTQRPGLVDQLVQLGEEFTQFEYNPTWVAPQR